MFEGNTKSPQLAFCLVKVIYCPVTLNCSVTFCGNVIFSNKNGIKKGIGSLNPQKKKKKRAIFSFTCIPALPISFLCPLQPGLVPGMGEVYQQDQLDEDEDERAHDAEIIPH